MLRSLAIAVSVCLIQTLTFGQQAELPAYHGGSPFRTLDIKDLDKGSLKKETSFDFNKFSTNKFVPPTTRKCGTTETEKTRSLSQKVESKESFEEWMNQRTTLESVNRRSTARGQKIYTLPVVFHVIYSKPEENISKEQILSQLEVLNRDYRRTNADKERTPRAFGNIAVDPGIEFCLAGVDPQGQPTDGIHRVSMSGAPFTESFMNGVVKPQTIWDPEKYMNIWVASLSNGILGFAQFPESGNVPVVGLPGAPGGAKTDGVVLNYLAVGTMGTAISPFNKGRTATHEIGHFLGLRHIWGDGPCGEDDFCDDTPETSSPTFNCPPSGLSCDGQRAMIENFMDYTDDACMNLFTISQRLRMRTVLENSPRRKSLLNSDACGAGIAPPEPAFAANLVLGCAPMQIQFKDISTNQPQNWKWTFAGGRPSSSNKQNPKVTYRNPGVYPVTLEVSNKGGSRAITKKGYIEVLSSNDSLPYLISFEDDSDFPPRTFTKNIEDDDFQWTITHLVSGEGLGKGSMTINNFDNNLLNASDWFVSPLLDVNDVENLILSFDLAYAPFSSKYEDTLGVFIAGDCGTVFKSIYYKGGKRLNTTKKEGVQKKFVPTNKEWRKELINLNAYKGFQSIQVAFVTFNGHGNNLFLDNIYIGEQKSNLPDPIFTQNTSSICPGQEIQFKDLSEGKITKRVWSFPGGIPASDTSLVPRVTYDSAGSYDVFLTLINEDGERTTEKKEHIRVREVPSLKLNASKTRICKGEEITLEAEADVNYQWVVDENDKIPDGNLLKISPRKDFVYKIKSDGTGSCKAESSVAIRVDQEKKLTITPPKAKICSGESIDLQVTGADSYVWSPNENLNTNVSGRITASPGRTSTYTVVGTTSGGCVIKDSILIEVEGGPEGLEIIASKTELCKGEKLDLIASGASGYTWFPSFGLNRTDGAKVIAFPENNTIYTVNGLSPSGCKASKSIELTVHPGPSINASADKQTICSGEEVELNARGAESYTWIGSAGLLDNDGPTVYANPEESATYTVIGTTGFNCTDTARVFVDVFETAKLDVKRSKSSVCIGERVTLKVSGAKSYQWYQNGSRLDLSPRTTEYTALIYDPTTIKIVGTDVRGCEIQEVTKIEVTDNQVIPEASFVSENRFTCAGQEVEFSSTSIGATQYFWEFPGGTPRNSTRANPSVVYKEEGVYDVFLVIRSCSGEEYRAERTKYVVVGQPFEFTISDETVSLCKGSSYTIQAEGALDYEWFPAEGLSTTQGNEVSVSPLRDMEYTVIAKNENGCFMEKTFEVKLVEGKDPVQIDAVSPIICEGSSISLSVNDPGIGLQWTPSESLESSDGNTVLASPKQTTLYTVTRRDMDGCESSDTLTVKVIPTTPLSLVPEKIQICPGTSTTLKVLNEGVYSWTPSYGLNTTVGQEVIAYPGENTTYTVTGTDASGCPSEGKVTVEVNDPTTIKVTALSEQICLGDTTSISVEGSSNISWSPSRGLSSTKGNRVRVFPTETTTYTLSTGSDECSTTREITIEVVQPEPVVINPAHPEICAGESIMLMATNSSSYEWEVSPGLSSNFGSNVEARPSQTTSYTVSGYDINGCPTKGSVTVTVHESNFLEATASASSFCEGDGELSLSARGATSYEWLPADGLLGNTRGLEVKVAPEEASVYKVVGTNEYGCKDTAEVEVVVRAPLVDFGASKNEVDLAQEGETGEVRFFDKTPKAKSWLWDFGDGGISREMNPSHIYTQPGNYTVSLQVSDGTCYSTALQTITVKNSSSLYDISEEGNIKVTEGDSKGIFILSIESPRAMALEVRLLDGKGAQLLAGILQVKPGTYTQEINLTGYSKGTYTLQILDGAEATNLELSIE
ncbi:MAG: PKD domain-containing protein [Bacteroidia bacterium]|nr:PKD domain-containing protein [Bacteroidia bacterium]